MKRLENKARYTLVGLFLLIFLSAMVGFILWLARYDIKEINAKEYRVYSKTSIGGLKKNSIVVYKGLDIGSVEKIDIDPKNLERIEITLKITKPEVIKTNSYAVVQSQGVTGNKTIEIDGGTKEADVLVPKETSYAIIPLKKSFLDKITTSANNISSQIEITLLKFQKLLNEKNIKNIETILSNINELSKNFNTLTKTSLNSTLKNINNITKNIDKIVKSNVPITIDKIDKMSTDISLLTKDIKKLVNTDIKKLINNLKSTTDSTQNIDEVLYKLETTLEKIDSTVEEFNKNGGDMIFKTRAVNYGPGEKK
jgi:phospholipid/cholesterol/gamma-HCH transport system substrate-binding protein